MRKILVWAACLAILLMGMQAALAESGLNAGELVLSGETYELTVLSYAFEDASGARVTLSVPEDKSLLRLIMDGQPIPFSAMEEVKLSPDNSASPIKTILDAALDVNGQSIPWEYAFAEGRRITFVFPTQAMPAALLLYPAGGTPSEGLALDLDGLDSMLEEKLPVDISSISFTVQGVTYTVQDLQDKPIFPRENMMDGLEGHAILFHYEPSGATKDANSALYSGVKVVTPEGREIRTYSNAGNEAMPYSLYFGLPDGVLLGDCVLRVPADEGDQFFSLGGSLPANYVPSASAPTTAPTLAPATSPDLSPSPDPTDSPAPIPEQTTTPEPTPEPTPTPDHGAIVQSVLATLREETTDPWQLAIYDAGAIDISVDEPGLITFYLRDFNPQTKSLGTFNEKEPLEWIQSMLENIDAYGLEASLTLKDGEATADSVKELKRAIRKAAEATAAAFEQKSVRLAIAAFLLPMPTEKLTTAQSVYDVEYSDAFTEAVYRDDIRNMDEYEEDLVPLFYAQVSQSLTIKNGPHALVLKCKGVTADVLLEKARAKVHAYLSIKYEAASLSYSEVDDLLMQALLDEANAIRKTSGDSFSFTLDIDDLIAGTGGQDYLAFLEGYPYAQTVEQLHEDALNMPTPKGWDYPKNGRISGGSKGTKIVIKAPKDDMGRYIQVRDYETDEMKVDLFIRPGGSATVYVPRGDHYLLVAKGENWYGLDDLFGDEGIYSRIDDMNVPSSEYYLTITLETVTDGNMSTHGADASDFY